MSLSGSSSTGATMSGSMVSVALVGIPLNLAVCGSCTSTIPLLSLMAFIPKLPSEPIPESIIPILFSCLSNARDLKKVSIGKRKPCVSIGANKCKVPFKIDMLLLGGITYTQFGFTTRLSLA